MLVEAFVPAQARAKMHCALGTAGAGSISVELWAAHNIVPQTCCETCRVAAVIHADRNDCRVRSPASMV